MNLLNNYLQKLKSVITPSYKKTDFVVITVISLLVLGMITTTIVSQNNSNTRVQAATVNSVEPEDGTLAGNITIENDANASGGKYIKFGTSMITPTPTPTPTIETGTLLFDADVANKGLAGYAYVIHPERISIVDDPILGSVRKVMKFTVYDTDTGPTENPRAQVQSPRQFNDGDDIWIGFSMLFPADWPDALPPGAWFTLTSVYGPPFAGSAPVHIGMREDTPALTIHRNLSYNWDTAWRHSPIMKNTWYDVVLRDKLSQDPSIGFIELYLNTGTGWEQQTLQPGNVKRLYMKTLDATNNGGPNYSSLTHYRLAGMFDVLTNYYANHKVGTSFSIVAPHTYE